MPDPAIHCHYDAFVPAAELKKLVHARNPNRHTQDGIDFIGHVIEHLGWRHPIIVSNRIGQAVAGNGRIYATSAKGWTGAPVVYQNFPDEETEKAFLLADNRLPELSHRDDAAVATLLREMSEAGFDLTLSGYDDASVTKLLARLSGDESREGDEAVAPDPNAALAEKWGTAPGQVWNLGRHRLAIGDSRDPELWDRLMLRAPAHAVFTDPPFGVDYVDSKGRSIENDDLQRDDLADLLLSTFNLACAHTVSDCPFYVWHASSTRDDFSFAFKSAGLIERQYLTWCKDGFVLGHEDFHWQTEHAFYLSRQGIKPRWFGDRAQSTCWRIICQRQSPGIVVGKEGVCITDGNGRHLLVKESKPPKSGGKIRHFRIPVGDSLTLLPAEASTAWNVSRDPVTEYVHPNQKPAALAAVAIKNSTQPGETVLDYFAGSGSTLMGCEQHNRAARCIEKSPLYSATIIERWHAFTKQKPERAA